jgi:hypothetical protein
MNEKAAMINITAAFLSLFFKELSLQKTLQQTLQ